MTEQEIKEMAQPPLKNDDYKANLIAAMIREYHEKIPYISVTNLLVSLYDKYFQSSVEGEARPVNGEWHLCPKCHGTGRMFPEFPTTIGVSETCNLCNGAKVIVKPIIEKPVKEVDVEEILYQNGDIVSKTPALSIDLQLPIKEGEDTPKPFTGEMWCFLLANSLRCLTEEQRAGLCFDLYCRSIIRESIDSRIKELRKPSEEGEDKAAHAIKVLEWLFRSDEDVTPNNRPTELYAEYIASLNKL